MGAIGEMLIVWYQKSDAFFGRVLTPMVTVCGRVLGACSDETQHYTEQIGDNRNARSESATVQFLRNERRSTVDTDIQSAKAHFDGVAGQSGNTVCADLRHDAFAMRRHSLDAQMQPPADLFR